MKDKKDKKKKKMKLQRIIKLAYKENKRSSLLLYMILRALVIVCMILQILHGNFGNAMLCMLSLILLLVPLFVQNRFKITLPNGLEIAIYLFIFSAEILGEIHNFYGVIPFWDTMLHTINGFLAAAVGFSIVDLLNKNSKSFKLSPIYLCIVAFCFSMTIGVIWEFFEFGMDSFFKTDMQKDRIIETISSVELNELGKNEAVVLENIGRTIILGKNGEVLQVVDGGYLDIGIIDSMKDLIVNFVGAFVFSIFGYITLRKNKNNFIQNFVPTREKRKIPKSVKKELKKYDIKTE